MPKEHDYLFLMALGTKLAERREELGRSQADIAQYALITPQQLSKYEKGLSDPSLSTLLRICAALKLNCSNLLVQLTIQSSDFNGPLT